MKLTLQRTNVLIDKEPRVKNPLLNDLQGVVLGA